MFGPGSYSYLTKGLSYGLCDASDYRDQVRREMLAIRNDLPIILCAGYGYMISAETAKAVGISELLMEPVVRQEVAQMRAGSLIAGKVSGRTVLR